MPSPVGGTTLRGPGVGRGDRVAILSQNRPEMLLAILACGWIAAIAVPVNAAASRHRPMPGRAPPS